MTAVRWSDDEPLGVFDAGRPLGEMLRAAEERQLGWVVLEQEQEQAPCSVYYAFRLDELEFYTSHRPDVVAEPAAMALGLRPEGQSAATPGEDRPSEWETSTRSLRWPSELRLIALNGAGQPIAIGVLDGWSGEIEPLLRDFAPPTAAAKPPREEVAPGPAPTGADEAPIAETTNGETAEQEATVAAMLSADAPAQAAAGQTAEVRVRVELADGAAPLARSRPAEISLEEEITVFLAVDSREFAVEGDNRLRLPPPEPGQPATGSFTIRGLKLGAHQVTIQFYQGASDLGTIPLTVSVTGVAAAAERTTAALTAMRRDPRDDEVMILIIDEERRSSGICFSFEVLWKAVEWNLPQFFSNPLKKRSSLRYVQGIYQRIVEDVLPKDLPLFQDRLRGIGAEMSQQLFPDDLVRTILWPHRDQISAVQVTTDEPYIPWELARLRHPDTGEVDEKFLCEYGLVRSLRGRSGPRDLRAQRWRYLTASYPNFTLQPVGAEVGYFDQEVQPGGGEVAQIPADPGKLLDALKAPDFDVLHVSCHGQTGLKDAEQSVLIISDQKTPRGPRPVTLSPADVTGLGRPLAACCPLVFLNACESGQQAPVLTDWGGWPRAFWEAGCGAFVGTSWSVHEQPAANFTRGFYDALRGGATLAEAAAAGRAAAKPLGDATWLAYVVYGNPVARVVSG
ncbi:MAG TPA: CHAT domain-containing protein [Thermomicrobiaceae bacterium]|nr:CHAT domain-containing protein [Thermomicrobiaceae bacterium]